MTAPTKLIRKTVSRQLGGVEWRWESGRIAVWQALTGPGKGKWAALSDTDPRVLPRTTYHPDPETAARSVGATTEGT